MRSSWDPLPSAAQDRVARKTLLELAACLEKPTAHRDGATTHDLRSFCRTHLFDGAECKRNTARLGKRFEMMVKSRDALPLRYDAFGRGFFVFARQRIDIGFP